MFCNGREGAITGLSFPGGQTLGLLPEPAEGRRGRAGAGLGGRLLLTACEDVRGEQGNLVQTVRLNPPSSDSLEFKLEAPA